MIPEYRHTLKTAVVTLSLSNRDLSFQDSLLTSLPPYSRIIILLPEDNLAAIRHDLAGKPYASRTELIPFETVTSRDPVVACLNFHGEDMGRYRFHETITLPGGTPWAQDLFKALIDREGNLELFVPPIYRCLVKPGEIFQQDNLFIGRLGSLGARVETLPFQFAGGNILVGEIRGKKIAFCGTDILRESDALRKHLPKSIISGDKIRAMVKNRLNVDDVVFIGQRGKPQPSPDFKKGKSQQYEGYTCNPEINQKRY